ncbi:molybdenum cofactor guanylyltransferase [Psychrobacter sp. UBA3962]|uniref:molybdenum cofactor guanylyltransferase n=1 Tax=Psychrobacter sp. UBA3962 TaxID=1947352 RepID=UPI0025F662A3|nr:molybdenum cofactor guanylyltransferase [Psychrobacter sp. UBA3962]
MKAALRHNLEAQSLAGVVILAGGLSTRMGSPKALLKLPSGETLLDYHVRSAKQLGVTILIADNGQGFATQVETANRCINYIDDYQPHSSNPEAANKHSAGPLGAILAGMQQLLVNNDSDNGKDNCSEAKSSEVGSKWMLVVSCDSLVNASDIWHYLKAQSSATQSVPIPDSLIATAITDEEIVQPQMYGLVDNERDYPLLALYQLSLAEPLKAYLDSGERRVMCFISPISQSIAMPRTWYTLCNLNTPEQFQTACQQLTIK